MPKANVELVKTGRRIQNDDPNLWHACGSLDSDEYCILITFCEMPSEAWINEFSELITNATISQSCDPKIKNIKISEPKFVSSYFGINRLNINAYQQFVEQIKKLIDDVNKRFG